MTSPSQEIGRIPGACWKSREASATTEDLYNFPTQIHFKLYIIQESADFHIFAFQLLAFLSFTWKLHRIHIFQNNNNNNNNNNNKKKPVAILVGGVGRKWLQK